MRTGPVTRLSGVQMAEGKCDTVVNMIGGGPISHATLFRNPSLIKGRMARGLRNESSTVDLGGWTLAIEICSLLTLMCICTPA